MKALRRSIKGERGAEAAPRHISVPVKSELAIRPPKKVIKALYDYAADPGKPHELSFHKGDFFHVISREDDEDWYEAANPLIPSARGLVPVAFFEVIGKQIDRQSAGSQPSMPLGSPQMPDAAAMNGHMRNTSASAAGAMPMSAPRASLAGGKGKNGAMVYGIVQYDFQAERPDELDAKAGEAIIVIAQSNPEWFVAKPIGRLGGPGLIPVSFIEIKDMATGQAVTDPQEAVRRAGVPKVEEWKKLAADYKNSSITLGQFRPNVGDGLENGMARMSVSNGQSYSNQGGGMMSSMPHPQSPPPLQGGNAQRPLLAPINASVPRYCFENDKYWYIIECVLEDGSHWELSRYYQNFYDFQIRLLQAFPTEAGNGPNGSQRILPYMPGPVTYVTDHISNMRRESLDDYVKRLLLLPPYISRSEIVKELFCPRDGDFELDPAAAEENFRLSQNSRGSGGGYAQPGQNVGYRQEGSDQEAMRRAPSSITQDSRNSGGNNGSVLTPASSTAALNPPGSSGGGGGGGGGQQAQLQQAQKQAQHPGYSNNGQPITIKCWWGEDLVKVKVQPDISFEALREKLQERFKAREEIRVQWRDLGSENYHELVSDQDLTWVLERSQGKLILFADYL